MRDKLKHRLVFSDKEIALFQCYFRKYNKGFDSLSIEEQCAHQIRDIYRTFSFNNSKDENEVTEEINKEWDILMEVVDG